MLEFGRTLEADRVATIQGNRYAIEPRPESSGFQIQVTGADGFTETICSGYYGFEFNTFDRTVSYAVQRVRDRFVVEPERLCSNGCEISRRYHKRRESWVYAVTFPESLSGAKFKTQETRAKRCGGWYSREYRPEFQRGAFLFLSMRDADEFARDYRPTVPRNIPAEPAAVASNPPAAGFLDLQAELQDAETRVQRLNPRAGMTAAKWTVDGFDGTGGPRTVFDRKRDAIEYAVNNRRAIEARRNGSPGGYKWFRAADTESSDAVAPTEPVPGEFFAGTLKIRFSATGNNGNQYGACEQCDRTQGSEYWSLTRTRPYRDEDGITSYAHAGTQLICHDCAKRLQANLTASDAVAPTEPPAVPNFGDKVRTPDGIVGTMRGSGGLGSDRVGVADADGKLRTWANRSELVKLSPTAAESGRATLLQAMATKLETLADGMQKTIDEKTRPMTQNYTVKRGREYASRMHDGENLTRCQTALRVLAQHWKAGTVPAGVVARG